MALKLTSISDFGFDDRKTSFSLIDWKKINAMKLYLHGGFKNQTNYSRTDLTSSRISSESQMVQLIIVVFLWPD